MINLVCDESNFSVIIPTYNSEKFIKNTLDTVVNQTVTPLEVLIVDDGSEDSTCDVVQSFIDAYPAFNIRLLKESHCGPGHARNIGVWAAKGCWVAFLDSDDLWHPNKLELVIKAHRQLPEANFICHNEENRRLDGSTTILDYSAKYKFGVSLSEQLYRNNIFSTSAVVCSRDLVIEVGGFNSVLPSSQDYDLWLKMAPYINLLFVQEMLGTYVDRPGNISSVRSWRRMKDTLYVLNTHKNQVTFMTYIKSTTKCVIMFMRDSVLGLLRV